MLFVQARDRSWTNVSADRVMASQSSPPQSFHSVGSKIHKGPKEGCAVCAKTAYAAEMRKQKKKIRIQLKSNKCKSCGSKLHGLLKSDLCIKCRQVELRRSRLAREHPICKGVGCGKQLDYRNISGYCRECLHKTKE